MPYLLAEVVPGEQKPDPPAFRKTVSVTAERL